MHKPGKTYWFGTCQYCSMLGTFDILIVSRWSGLGPRLVERAATSTRSYAEEAPQTLRRYVSQSECKPPRQPLLTSDLSIISYRFYLCKFPLQCHRTSSGRFHCRLLRLQMPLEKAVQRLGIHIRNTVQTCELIH